MANIATSFGAKLGVAFVSVAMLFTLATPAQAQTLEELQALIATLQAQIAALTGGGGSSAAACTFTRSLTIGSQGADVTCLQNYLTGTGHFTFSGGATGYFGPVTQSAVAAWQAANGVSPAVGYFGPISQAKYAMVAGSTSGGGSGSGDSGSTDLSGGAGSISEADFLSDFNNEEVGEDQENIEVAGLGVEAEGSDIELTAIGIDFDKAASGNSNFDKYADEVSVWLDGEEIARVDADEFTRSNNYGKTISLDKGGIIRDGDKGELVVAVSGITNMDSNDEGDSWDVGITSVRFRDAQGASITDSSTGNIGAGDETTTVATDERAFSFESFVTSADVEVKISAGDKSINNAHTIQVDASNKTQNEAIFSFNVEVEGTSDVNVDEIEVDFNFTGTASEVNDIFSGLDLLVDGVKIGSETAPSGQDSVLFNDLNHDLKAGETYEFTVEADILATSAATYAVGDTVLAQIGSTERGNWVVDDENGDSLTSGTTLTGTAVGEASVYYASGFTFDLVSTSAAVTTTGDAAASPATSDIGTFTIKFDLTSFGSDIWIEKSTCEEDGDQAGSGEGISYIINNTANNTVSCSVASTASTDTSSWKIDEGTTETFTLTVAATATADHFAKVYLESINWSATASSNPASFFTAGLGEDNTSTDEIFLNDN